MTDLRFIIVNSNLLHAQLLMHELKSRVGFDVYQDTKEKNIWGLMDGGKDDIFVYDRCGRLAYYIPFPLSIMNDDSNAEGTLVPSAILATYYRSPCGTTCEKNSTTLEEFLNSRGSEKSSVETTTKIAPPTTEFSEEISTSLLSGDKNDILRNEISPVIVDDSPKTSANDSELNNFEYFDYPSYNDTLEDYENNETIPRTENTLFNSLYSFFFFGKTTGPSPTVDANGTLLNNLPSSEFIEISSDNFTLNVSDNNIQNEYNMTDTSPEVKVVYQQPKPKSERCAEADDSVCKSWSKKKLLRAHDCCSSFEADENQQSRHRLCKNFGKKRCKKIRTVLKCCIKTAFVEMTTQDPNVTMEDSTSEDVTAVTDSVTEINYDVVCCKDTLDGRLCHVSETPTCKEGEYISESVNPTEIALLEGTM